VAVVGNLKNLDSAIRLKRFYFGNTMTELAIGAKTRDIHFRVHAGNQLSIEVSNINGCRWKAIWTSTNEQTLASTWGIGTSTINGGSWQLRKI